MESYQSLNSSSYVQEEEAEIVDAGDADNNQLDESVTSVVLSLSTSTAELQPQKIPAAPPHVVPVDISRRSSKEDVTAPRASTTTVPSKNHAYGEMSYWDERFAIEDEYEWLVSFSDVAKLLLGATAVNSSQQQEHPVCHEPLLQKSDRILVVGCGNSKFSHDLYQAGYTNICNIDYSQTVIEGMKQKYQESCPEMQWMVMDMTNMSEIADESFDVVLDKAAMDALMVREGDVWHPRQVVIDQARSMCRDISRILRRSTGRFVQISFAQPHFRKKYLLGHHPTPRPTTIASRIDDNKNNIVQHNQGLGQASDESNTNVSHEFQWTLQVETIAEKGCFENFLYIMRRL